MDPCEMADHPTTDYYLEQLKQKIADAKTSGGELRDKLMPLRVSRLPLVQIAFSYVVREMFPSLKQLEMDYGIREGDYDTWHKIHELCLILGSPTYVGFPREAIPQVEAYLKSRYWETDFQDYDLALLREIYEFEQTSKSNVVICNATKNFARFKCVEGEEFVPTWDDFHIPSSEFGAVNRTTYFAGENYPFCTFTYQKMYNPEKEPDCRVPGPGELLSGRL